MASNVMTTKNTKKEIASKIDTAMLKTSMLMVGFHDFNGNIIQFLAIDEAESMKKITKLLKEL